MINDSGPTEWDFLSLVAWWNLYALPALLVVVTAVLLRRRRISAMTRWQDGLRSIRRIGLIHCALALHAFMSLVQELLTLRTMGIPESHVILIASSISTIVNSVLAIGLLRRRQAARRLAIAWYVVLLLIAVLAVAWLWHYGVAIDPGTWPVQLASKGMPVYLLCVMLMPRTKLLFARDARSAVLTQEGKQEGLRLFAEAPVVWPVVSLLTLLFLIVVCSNLVVDMADWCYRLTFDADAVP